MRYQQMMVEQATNPSTRSIEQSDDLRAYYAGEISFGQMGFDCRRYVQALVYEKEVTKPKATDEKKDTKPKKKKKNSVSLGAYMRF